VTIAPHGKEALRLLIARAFDLILMDIQMPEMDGLETTHAIRQQEEGTDRHMPIVALTANVLNGDRERCLQAGMDGYVSKPIQSVILFQAMADALLDRRRGA